MSAEEVGVFVAALKTPPQTGDDLANELVQAKKITRFQAEMIAEGRGQSIILDRYVIKDKIGAGGMGQVYLAEHQRMEREVALKVLPPDLVKNQESVQRFHQEVKAAAKLSHRNIVTAYDANEDQGTHFLVMEYVPGKDLSSTVRINGPLSVEVALDMIKQVSSGLGYAHQRGIIHRDIKPANLLLDEEGVVKILDMGLARIDSPGEADDGQGLTGTGMVMGTVDFMAPEQALDTRSADGRSDIYSLGCTLFYLLTGKPLFTDDTVMKKLMALQTQSAPSLSECRGGITPEVEDLYQKMVAKKPEERFQSMTEVAQAIERCTSKATTGATEALITEDAALREFLQNQSLRESATIMQKQDEIVAEESAQEQTFITDGLGRTVPSMPPTKTSVRTTKGSQRGGARRHQALLYGLGGGAALILLLGLYFVNQKPDGTTARLDSPKRIGIYTTLNGSALAAICLSWPM